MMQNYVTFRQIMHWKFRKVEKFIIQSKSRPLCILIFSHPVYITVLLYFSVIHTMIRDIHTRIFLFAI